MTEVFKILILVSIFCSGAQSQATPQLTFPTDANGVIRAKLSTLDSFVDKDLSLNGFSVYVENDRHDYQSNAIQGKYVLEDDCLVFKPYFPFEAGLSYFVKMHPTSTISDENYSSFTVGKKQVLDKPDVLRIYPTAHELPENLLRFYVYFNTPMQRGKALKYIKLVNENGIEDKNAFMALKQELWSSDGKRLTLLFDPGRIKRGVSTNVKLGAALRKGESYKLIISADWNNMSGHSLSKSVIKEFKVIDSYRSILNIDNWDVYMPRAHTKDPVKIKTDRIVDHALVQSMIDVVDAQGNLVDGVWEVLEEEKVISFASSYKWKKGTYQMIVYSRFEDVAGNSLQNMLDYRIGENQFKSDPFHTIELEL